MIIDSIGQQQKQIYTLVYFISIIYIQKSTNFYKAYFLIFIKKGTYLFISLHLKSTKFCTRFSNSLPLDCLKKKLLETRNFQTELFANFNVFSCTDDGFNFSSSFHNFIYRVWVVDHNVRNFRKHFLDDFKRFTLQFIGIVWWPRLKTSREFSQGKNPVFAACFQYSCLKDRSDLENFHCVDFSTDLTRVEKNPRNSQTTPRWISSLL